MLLHAAGGAAPSEMAEGVAQGGGLQGLAIAAPGGGGGEMRVQILEDEAACAADGLAQPIERRLLGQQRADGQDRREPPPMIGDISDRRARRSGGPDMQGGGHARLGSKSGASPGFQSREGLAQMHAL